MIKVLQILEATEGGTRRHLNDLVTHLAPARFAVVMAVATHRTPDFITDLAAWRQRGLQIALLPMRRGLHPWNDLRALRQLLNLVRRTQPDVIHAHSAKAGFLARLVAKKTQIPVVYTPHGYPFLITTSRWQAWLYRGLERLVARYTTATIVVSQEEQRAALALGIPRRALYLIPNQIPLAPRGAIAVRHRGTLKIGFFGRLVTQKGVDLLLEAAHLIVKRHPRVVFHLHGTGPRLPHLARQVAKLKLKEHIHFAGAYQPAQTQTLMQEMDIVVIPSRWEGYPYVALEAFQAGVPVVAMAVGGLKEMIKHDQTGLSVLSGNIPDLSSALLALLLDADRRKRLAHNAYEALQSHGGLEQMVNAITTVYEKVVPTHPRR